LLIWSRRSLLRAYSSATTVARFKLLRHWEHLP
jgi:hypothetical protein